MLSLLIASNVFRRKGFECNLLHLEALVEEFLYDPEEKEECDSCAEDGEGEERESAAAAENENESTEKEEDIGEEEVESDGLHEDGDELGFDEG